MTRQELKKTDKKVKDIEKAHKKEAKKVAKMLWKQFAQSQDCLDDWKDWLVVGNDDSATVTSKKMGPLILNELNKLIESGDYPYVIKEKPKRFVTNWCVNFEIDE